MISFGGISSRSIMALVGLIIAAGAGAYYYHVYLPETESKTAKAVQAPVKPPMIAKKLPDIAKLPPVQIPPAASAVPAAAAAATPVQLAAAPQHPPIPEQKPETVKPEPVAHKPAPKKTKVKSQPVKTAKVDKPSVPELPRETIPPAPIVLPEPVAIATMPTMTTPKYNDMLTAALRGDMDGVRQLLDLGRWVDKPGDSGLTPLMAAIMNRDTQMAQLLLGNGAKPTAQALDFARKHKDAAIVLLLEQHSER